MNPKMAALAEKNIQNNISIDPQRREEELAFLQRSQYEADQLWNLENHQSQKVYRKRRKNLLFFCTTLCCCTLGLFFGGAFFWACDQKLIPFSIPY